MKIKKGKLDVYCYRIMAIFLGIILVYGSFFGENAKVFGELILYAPRKGYFLPVFWIYALYVSLVAMLLKHGMKNGKKVGGIIFVIAILPRLILCIFDLYVPDNDFRKYLEMGQNIYYGNFAKVASVVDAYQLPSLGGLAVFNGLLAFLFSPTLIGYQLANCMMTSLSCVMLYYIVKDYNKNIAAIAAFLYAIYPANIIASQVTMNNHGAVLFALFSIYLYLLALKGNGKRVYIMPILAGIMMAVSQFIHASSLIYILALVFYTLFIIYQLYLKKEKEKMIGLLKCILAFYISFWLVGSVGTQMLYKAHIINSTEGLTILTKVVVGLNQETRGKKSPNNAEFGDLSTAPHDVQVKGCLEIIKEEIKNPYDVMTLMIEKTDNTWFGMDSNIWWYTKGFSDQCKADEEAGADTRFTRLQEKVGNFSNAAMRLDLVFVRMIYIFTILALVLRKRESVFDVMDLMLFLTLGWVSIYFFIEIQGRYRYAGMPAFMVLAAAGVYLLYSKMKQIIEMKKRIVKSDELES